MTTWQIFAIVFCVFMAFYGLIEFILGIHSTFQIIIKRDKNSKIKIKKKNEKQD